MNVIGPETQNGGGGKLLIAGACGFLLALILVSDRKRLALLLESRHKRRDTKRDPLDSKVKAIMPDRDDRLMLSDGLDS